MTGEDFERLAGGVRRAARRTAHLSREDRRRALRLWLAHVLAGAPREDTQRLLSALSALYAPEEQAAEPAPAARPEPAARQEAGPDLVAAFAERYFGRSWQPTGTPEADRRRGAEALEELERRLRELVPGGHEEGTGLADVVRRLSEQQERSDKALRLAAKEAFDRVLDSVNPAMIEGQGERKAVKLGPFHRAGLYDAWCERFEHLRAYHAAGRMVADLRASFRRHLRDTEEEKEAPR